jgi:uncharacterized protein (UPF0335 family)
MFKPIAGEITLEKENKLLSDDIIAVALDISTRSFIVKEMRIIISNENNNKENKNSN